MVSFTVRSASVNATATGESMFVARLHPCVQFEQEAIKYANDQR